MGAWVMRVPTDDNIADEPSRREYEALRLLQAKFVPDACFESPQAWESLSFANVRGLKRAAPQE